MTRRQLEVASTSLVRLGWLVTIVCCALPFWRGTKVSEEIIIWEGLWFMCEAQGLEILRCVKYSRMTLPQDIQVSRVLVVTCIVITWMGLLLDRFRGDTTCVPNTSIKDDGGDKCVVPGTWCAAAGVCVLDNTQCYQRQLSLSPAHGNHDGAGSAPCCFCWEEPS